MSGRHHGAALALAAAASLAFPAGAMPAATVMVPLCGGGSVPLHIPGQDRSGAGKACHACLLREPARVDPRKAGKKAR